MQNGREARGMARYRGRMAPRVPLDASGRLRAAAGPVRARRMVAGRDPVRGRPGGDPGPEHVLDERRAGARRAARARPPDPPGARTRCPRRSWRELFRASGTFNVKARRVRAFLDFLEGALRRRRRAHGRRRPVGAARVPARRARDRARDRRLHRPLCRGTSVLRRGCLHPPRLRTAGPPAGRRDLRGGPAHLHRRAAGRCPLLWDDYHGQIVRVAKDACRARPLCAACPLEDVCPRVRSSEARVL